MCPREDDLAVQEEGGLAGDSEPVGSFVFRPDTAETSIAMQETVDLIADESGFGRDACEYCPVADVFAPGPDAARGA